MTSPHRDAPPVAPERRTPEAAHPPRRKLLKGSALPLAYWRALGFFDWVIKRWTPESWWRSPYFAPGVLVLTSISGPACPEIERILEIQRNRRLLRILNYQSLDSPGHEDPNDPAPLAGAWRLQVSRGSERPIMEELLYRVALALERVGGYEGIDPMLSLQVARDVVVAHRARRIRLAQWEEFAESVDVVAFNETHIEYSKLVANGPLPTEPVTVAILDTAVNVDHVPEKLRDRIHFGSPNPAAAAFRPGLHGTVIASVIADLAPNAIIQYYPVITEEALSEESELISALNNTKATVIVMAMELSIPPDAKDAWSRHDNIKTTLARIGTDRIALASSGNREPDGTDDAAFPGYCEHVVMVGAVDRSLRRPPYSRYLFSANESKLFVVAPGGRDEPVESPVNVGEGTFYGTSLAVAYAAGVTARILGVAVKKTDGSPATDAPKTGDLVEAIKQTALKFDGWVRTEHGEGLIRQGILSSSLADTSD